MPPPTLKSNPSDDERVVVVVATLVCTLTALVVLLLRVFVRARIIRNFGWDDAAMCLAMLLSLAGEGIIIAEAHYGAGRHVGDIPSAMYSEGMKMNVISGPIYVVAVATVKVSVGLALLRIAGHTAYRYLVMTVMVIMGSWAFLSIFTIIFQCSNPAMRWDSSVKGTCWPQHVVQSLGYTDATLNIATDVFFAVVIPIPLFWNLNVNRRTRVSLIAVLGLGVFACAASIIKTVYLYNLGNYSDWLWDSRNISIWHVVELNTGVVAGSLPAMRPLFRGVLGGSTWDREHRNVYLRSSQLGTTASSGKKSTWFRAVTRGRGSGATDEADSERAFNTGGKDQGGSEPGPYELGYLGTRRSTMSTSFVTTGGKSSGGTKSAQHQGRTKGQWGIRKTSTTTVDFEDVVGLAK